MDESKLTRTNWGRLLLDARNHLRGLGLPGLPENRFVVLPKPKLADMEHQLPICFVSQTDRVNQRSTSGQIDVRYGLSVAILRVGSRGNVNDDHGEELEISEGVNRAFEGRRDWGNITGGCLLDCSVERSICLPGEASSKGYDAHYFFLRCWVRENI